MAKLLSDPVTADDLAKFLETSDFQLELDVFNAFVAHGVRPSLGGIYADPVTGKDRQYDIRAEINHGICTLHLAVECKNLKPNFPMLVSRVPRLSTESYHEVILGRQNSLPKQSGDIFVARGQIFRSGEPVGKSLTQVGKALSEGKQLEPQLVVNDAPAYDKWSQAIASAQELVTRCGHSSLGSDSVNAAVVQPILVVPDETLWVANYSADGVLTGTPTQTPECTVFLGKKMATAFILYTVTHLLIFTKSAL